MLLDPTSLVNTLDAINERFLFGEPIPSDEGLQIAQWIATRQGEKGAYRGMFAPTQQDFEQGIRLFTGERLVSASARHIIGQEASRRYGCLATRMWPHVKYMTKLQPGCRLNPGSSNLGGIVAASVRWHSGGITG